LLQHSTETYEEAEECLRINYFGTKYVTEALLPLLQASSDGRLVNVSSNYGLLRVNLSSAKYYYQHFSGINFLKIVALRFFCFSISAVRTSSWN
jgi:short-subunit dehydrogenase